MVTFFISRGNTVSQRQSHHFQTSLFSTSKTYIHKWSFICLCFHESVPNYLKSDFQTSLMFPWPKAPWVDQWLNTLEKQGIGAIPQLVPMLQTPGTPLLFKGLGNLYCKVSRRNKCCLQHLERDPAPVMLSLLNKMQGTTMWLLQRHLFFTQCHWPPPQSLGHSLVEGLGTPEKIQMWLLQQIFISW